MRRTASTGPVAPAAVAVLAIGALVVTGCSTKCSAGSSAPTSATSSSVTASWPWQRVTATTNKFGIIYPDLAAIRNVVNIDQSHYKPAYTASIGDDNKHGGINGRMLEPVFATVNPIGTAPADAACT